MMKITVQTGNLSLLKEALVSDVKSIRFGSEFCMYALPTSESVERAYSLTRDAGKKFTYVTPRLAESAMDSIKEHLILLNEIGEATVIANDLGTIHALKGQSLLKPALGRQLVYTPSRCPWNQITEESVNIFTKRKVSQIFYQTALNYQPTIDFYRGLGAVGADVDWIPELFSNLNFIINNGLPVSVHMHSVPVAITRKCHMARFLGEEDLDRCSRPCYTKAYSMENEYLGIDMVVQGNTVYKLNEPDRKTARQLANRGVSELVLTMSPITGVSSREQIESLIHRVQV
jgi:hypothetical protein